MFHNVAIINNRLLNLFRCTVKGRPLKKVGDYVVTVSVIVSIVNVGTEADGCVAKFEKSKDVLCECPLMDVYETVCQLTTHDTDKLSVITNASRRNSISVTWKFSDLLSHTSTYIATHTQFI